MVEGFFKVLKYSILYQATTYAKKPFLPQSFTAKSFKKILKLCH